MNSDSWRKSTYSGGQGGQCVEVGQDWRKSSYSSGQGGQCVEVGQDWRKSTYSGGQGGECVEVGQGNSVLVRDTKDNGTGPVLRIDAGDWASFLRTLR